MTAETSNARGEWVLVPRVPTPEMVQASNEISCRAEGEEHWAAMLAAAPQPPAEGVQAGNGCHCATCTCEPNMTPAVRFDLSPAQKEGAIREHLIRLGWTPPAADAEAKTVPVPTRVHLIGETAVIVGTPGRGWDEEGPEAHNCDAMGCATIGPHVLARVPFTDERDLAQQPAAVDEFAADRERLLRAFMMECGIIGAKEAGVNLARGIKAALAAQQQEPKP